MARDLRTLIPGLPPPPEEPEAEYEYREYPKHIKVREGEEDEQAHVVNDPEEEDAANNGTLHELRAKRAQDPRYLSPERVPSLGHKEHRETTADAQRRTDQKYEAESRVAGMPTLPTREPSPQLPQHTPETQPQTVGHPDLPSNAIESGLPASAPTAVPGSDAPPDITEAERDEKKDEQK